MDLYKIIVTKENYSEWGREALIEKIERENDHQLIDLEIKKHENIIKELQQKKQNIPHIDKDKVREILDQWYHKFKAWKTDETEDFIAQGWIRKNVIPELKKVGCKDLDARAILNKFMSGKIDVN